MEKVRKIEENDVIDFRVDYEERIMTIETYEETISIHFAYLREFFNEEILSHYKQKEHEHSFDGGISGVKLDYQRLIEDNLEGNRSWQAMIAHEAKMNVIHDYLMMR